MIITQTLAIFYDAYRRLKAKKMFWVVLGLSLLVVLSMACLGIGPNGMSFMAWNVSSGPNTHDMPAAVFYKNMIFHSFGINIWLSWAACILALISTAGIFPDFISAGSIDMVLSKPIGRVRLFLTQYASGLLFVALQVTVFSLGSFLVIGIRGGAWEFDLFLAVPLVVCFFSYLFAFCALLGVLTRSTLASLLLTLLFWFLMFGLNSTDNSLMTFAVMKEQEASRLEKKIAGFKAEDEPLSGGESIEIPSEDEADYSEYTAYDEDPDSMKERLAETRSSIESMRSAQKIIVRIKTFLPKTAETVGLLQRFMIDLDDIPAGNGAPARQIMAEQRERSVGWIVGTSLCFEAVILALGAWVFRRRDY